MSRHDEYIERILLEHEHRKAIYEYDANDNCIYLGLALDLGEPTSNESFWIWKFTWAAGTVSGYNCTLKEGYIYAAWDDRATLGWE